MKRQFFLDRKERLFSPKTSHEELIRSGDAYLESDRLNDAVAFYRQAGHLEGLNSIRRRAVEDGDVFLFREALDGMETPEVEPDEWRRLARQAESKGRWQDALKAYQQLQDAGGVQRARGVVQRMMQTFESVEDEDPDD